MYMRGTTSRIVAILKNQFLQVFFACNRTSLDALKSLGSAREAFFFGSSSALRKILSYTNLPTVSIMSVTSTNNTG